MKNKIIIIIIILETILSDILKIIVVTTKVNTFKYYKHFCYMFILFFFNREAWIFFKMFQTSYMRIL
jgi:hypothetical protein